MHRSIIEHHTTYKLGVPDHQVSAQRARRVEKFEVRFRLDSYRREIHAVFVDIINLGSRKDETDEAVKQMQMT